MGVHASAPATSDAIQQIATMLSGGVQSNSGTPYMLPTSANVDELLLRSMPTNSNVGSGLSTNQISALLSPQASQEVVVQNRNGAAHMQTSANEIEFLIQSMMQAETNSPASNHADIANMCRRGTMPTEASARQFQADRATNIADDNGIGRRIEMAECPTPAGASGASTKPAGCHHQDINPDQSKEKRWMARYDELSDVR